MSNNIINKDDSKAIPAIHIELPVYKELVVNVTSEKKVGPEQNVTKVLDEKNKTLIQLCSNKLETLENEIFNDEIINCEVPIIDNGTALILPP